MKLDIFSLQIVSKYLIEENDFINILLTSTKCRYILDRFRINPIPITDSSKRLFQCIQTQLIFKESDLVLDIVKRKIILYKVNYTKFKQSKSPLNEFKNIALTKEDLEKEFTIIPKEVNILEPISKFTNLTTITLSSSIKRIERETFSSCQLTEVMIPNSVTYLGKASFKNCTFLKKVVLSLFIHTLKSETFSGCQNLSEINLTDSITTIQKSCFRNCFLQEVVLSDSLVSVGDGAFSFCKVKTVICARKEIPHNCFSQCQKLKVLELGTEVEFIGENCFENCSKLKHFECPQTLKYIGQKAFIRCSKLKEVELSENVIYIGQKAFSKCIKLEKLVIHNQRCYIGDNFINQCTNLNQLECPQYCGLLMNNMNLSQMQILDRLGVKYGDFCANKKQTCFDGFADYVQNTILKAPPFSKREEVTSLYIPETIHHLESFMFFYFIKLKEVTLPRGVVVHNFMFSECSQLTQINLPEDLKAIPSYLIFNCNKIRELKIPESVTKIEGSAFKNCGLRGLTIPKNVQSIGKLCISKCKCFSSLKFLNNRTSFEKLFDNKIAHQLKNNNIQFKHLHVNIKDGNLNNIKTDNSGCLYTIKIKNSEQKILEIPHKVIEIESITSEYITQIVILSGVTKLYPRCFNGVKYLHNLQMKCVLMKKAQHIFDECCFLDTLDIGKNKEEMFEVNYPCALRMKKIGYCNMKCTFEEKSLKDTQMLLMGTSSIKIKKDLHSNVSLLSLPSSISKIERMRSNDDTLKLPLRIKKLGDRAFYQNNCVYLEGHNLSSIGTLSCFSCKYLKSVLLSSSLKHLKQNAFEKCFSLESIVIPQSIEEIGTSCFQECISLKDITYLGEKGVWGDRCFSKCYSLRWAVLPTIHGEEFFIGCNSLETVRVTNGTKEMNNHVFENCYSLSKIDIPPTVEHLGNKVFSNCVSLKEIELPKSVNSVGYKTFLNCQHLERCVFANKNVFLSENVFDNCPLLSSIFLSNSLLSNFKTLLSYDQMKTLNKCGIECQKVVLTQHDVVKYQLKQINDLPQIQKLDDCCFKNNEMSSFVIPTTVTSIGEFCFKNCRKLSSISIPKSVSYISSHCFDGCTSLSIIDFHPSLKFSSSCFKGCNLLKTLLPQCVLETPRTLERSPSFA
ncbi:hypothetical protein EIN_486870 [Entamoeba invadens IP1]|uniref:Leucine rich repeat containing protein BspA family protein n=1 Tax=Entamoeba invadens IP1 TaxID=370355 RepID=A0A0A1U870_ENTIV|nr:hypothetical protein EIN_486870 [Entamoeba invadens IP1]ELP89225.1 hypothetical protein EIN_486870 [Entamoeba invadens IP1]|eukprot:XP_004255996.1 hypothetical protein EIN_486870 [Entamoeba invadens IP1]